MQSRLEQFTEKDKSLVLSIQEIDDPDEAIATANRLLSDHVDPNVVVNKIRQGRKRHPGYGLHKVRLLDGVAYQTSCQIRKVVGLRYSGFGDSEIERLIGVTPKYINKLEVRYPKGFQQAREELLKSAVTEYNQNVAFARAALSESGFAAVDTLTKVMEDPEAKTAERIKAAELVLKLTMGAPGQSVGEMAGEIISSFGDALSKISKSSRSVDYIEDITDSEVVDVEETDVDDQPGRS